MGIHNAMSNGNTRRICNTLIIKSKSAPFLRGYSEMLNMLYKPFTFVNIEFIPMPKKFSLHINLSQYTLTILLKKHLSLYSYKELYEIEIKIKEDGEFDIQTDAYEEELAEGFMYRLKKVDEGIIFMYSFGDEDAFEEPDYECDERFCIANFTIGVNSRIELYGHKSDL